MWQGRNWRRAVLAGLAATMAGLATPGTALAADELDLTAVDRFVTDFADNADYPGVAVAITNGDRVLHVGGYGHDSSGAAVTASTPMPLASVSKSFTALAVMRLVEAGKVELDTPVRDYVPDFRIADPRGSRITVRQLLNHTSGISDRTLAEKSLPQPDSLAGAVVRARDATLAADPGTTYQYTNTNYHLAARLVELVAAEPFADHLRRHVFEPTGMLATTTIDRTPRDLPSVVAKGHAAKGHIYAYGASVPVTEPDRFVAGSDGVITTAEDMARWLIAHSTGGRTASGDRLVSAKSVTAMHTPAGTPQDSTYGLGWDTGPDGRVHHSGIWFTYTASQLLLPSGHGIAVLGNSGFGLGNEGTASLANGLADLLTGATPTVGAPVRLITDLVLAALTLVSVALGIRNLRRGHLWARRFVARPAWRPMLRLLPRFLPLTVLVLLPDLLGLLVGGGRDITFVQLAHYSVALVVWTVVASAMNLGVVAVRAVALAGQRHGTDDHSQLVTG